MSKQVKNKNSEHVQIRTLLDRQREQILADCQAEIRRHKFQANYDRRSVQKLSETIESLSRKNFIAFKQKNFNDKINNYPTNRYWSKTAFYVKPHQRSLKEMEELKKFQSSTFDTIARRKFIDDQNIILELSGRIQELQNEINCMNDSRDFQDAESVRSANSHVTSQPVSFPPHPTPEGMLSRSFVSPSRREGPPSIWDTHGLSGNVFVNPDAPSSAPYPQELNPWSSSTEEPLLSSTVEKSEKKHQFRNRDASLDRQPKNQSSLVREILHRTMGQANNDCRLRTFILTSSLHQQPLLAGR